MALFFRLDGTEVLQTQLQHFAVTETITTSGWMQCSRHRKAALVLVDRQTSGGYAGRGSPRVKVSGCCKEFVELVAKRLM
jgi:hypothetical protein